MKNNHCISQIEQNKSMRLTKQWLPYVAVLLLLAAPLISCKDSNIMGSFAAPKEMMAGQEKLVCNPVAVSKKEYCTLKDRSGNFWLAATGEGVYCYNGKTFTHFTVADGLTDNTVSCMLEDKDGNIWFGTLTGVCRYDGKVMTNLALPDNNIARSTAWELLIKMTNTLKYPNTVDSIKQDSNGNVWFTTKWGIYCYDGKVIKGFINRGC